MPVLDAKGKPLKVGVKVRATSEAPYRITADGWTGIVTRIERERIYVYPEDAREIARYLRSPEYGDDGYEVRPNYFVRRTCDNKQRTE
jgi:hypothetical protein